MFDALFIVSILGTCVQTIKDSLEPIIPAENWRNKELYYEDVVNSVPIEQRMKNLKYGKYKAIETLEKPHRLEDGRILIENCSLYNKDLNKYGATQTMKWVKQGKYNLSPEENEKEIQRIREKRDYLYSLL